MIQLKTIAKFKKMRAIIVCVLLLLGMSCSRNSNQGVCVVYPQTLILEYGHIAFSPEGTVVHVLSEQNFNQYDLNELQKRTGTSERFAVLSLVGNKDPFLSRVRINEEIYRELESQGVAYHISHKPRTFNRESRSDGTEVISISNDISKYGFQFLGHLTVSDIKLRYNQDFYAVLRQAADLPSEVKILNVLQQEDTFSMLIGTSDTSELQHINEMKNPWIDIDSMSHVHLIKLP